MSEEFSSVKAILDNIATRHNRDLQEANKRIAVLFDALKEIAKIKDDNEGNGLKLARMLAQQTIEAAGNW